MDYSDGQLPNQQTTIAGGLTRYRSAPCSYLDAGGGGGVTELSTGQPRPLSPETESILARFMDNYSDPIPGNSTADNSQIQINDNNNNDNNSESPASEMIHKNPPLMNYNDNDNNSVDVWSSNFKISSSSVGNKSSLVRHRSSPAGLFDHINIQNNGKYEFRNQISSSGQINFSGSAFQNGGGNLKQNNDSRDVEFLDSVVACKMRAKRGHATHPRSIAERTRRGKISRRLGKLQELVPNMDKQTNTSDMLDLAVDYIKDLRNQVQTLTENQARCTCETSS